MKLFECLKRLFMKKRKTPSPTKDVLEGAAPPWLKVMEAEMGTHEIPGALHNQRILEYHQSTRLFATTDEIPWCSAFVNWAMDQVEVGGTESAAARSWMNWGVATRPKLGAITVFWRKSPESWQGHVGCYISEDEEKIYVIGGNQGDKVSIAGYPKKQLLGYRWPKENENGK